MNPEYIVGSIIFEGRPQPFVMNTRTAKLEVGTYTKPDETQQNLSVIQQQRFVLLIAERTGVSFAEVRLGQYHCSECGQWVEATPEQWSLSVCLSCSMDRASEMHERYQEQAEAEASVAAPVAQEEQAEAPTPEEDAPEDDFIAAVLLPSEGVMLEKAIRLAVEAHSGQVDKAGAPYIIHPLRMMMTMGTAVDKIVAVLHDVVEDTGWTLEALLHEGFSEEVVEAVACVTRQEDESYEAFIERSAQHPIARRVKLADLEDNMDVRRIDSLTEKDQSRLVRYQKAWRRLKEL